MSKFRIESGIAVPSRKEAIYPWADMLDGDSFLVEGDEQELRIIQRRLYTAGRAWIKRHRSGEKARIATRLEPDGVRVWLEVD